MLSKITNEIDFNKLSSINKPILKALGNFISYDVTIGECLMCDEKFQSLVLCILFSDSPANYLKETLWVLSNILAGPSE